MTEEATREAIVRHTALSDFYGLVNYLLQQPTPQVAEELAMGSMAEDLRSICAELGVEEAAIAGIPERLDALHQDFASNEDALGALRRDYTRVFVYPKNPLLMMHEGAFLDEEKRRGTDKYSSALLFVNPAAIDCERYMKALDVWTASNRVPADCITTELQLMALMHARIANALIEGEQAQADEMSETLVKFRTAHQDNWVELFYQRVTEICQHDAYLMAAALGTLLHQIDL